MRERKYVCKLDKWLSEKMLEESWSGVALTLAVFTVSYIIMYYLPEIMFYIQGYVTLPRNHAWTMTWVSILFAIILFFNVLKIIRLLRNKPFPIEEK
jgi:hypothetical protein